MYAYWSVNGRLIAHNAHPMCGQMYTQCTFLALYTFNYLS